MMEVFANFSGMLECRVPFRKPRGYEKRSIFSRAEHGGTL